MIFSKSTASQVNPRSSAARMPVNTAVTEERAPAPLRVVEE
jgi:hypothetical protein